MLRVERLTGNFQTPLVTTEEKVRLSWQLVSDQCEVWQRAYQIQVRQDHASSFFYDSGKVVSEQSVAVPLPKGVFTKGRRYQVQVCLWSDKGEVSPFSEPLEILICPTNNIWQGQFITADVVEGDQDRSDARYLRKEYLLPDAPVRAIASVS
ncbi:MAG: hypothetical protein ACQ5SW_07855, partial [Sphaerochaetaceae bacterium]